MATEPAGMSVPPPEGKCRFCGEETWRRDPAGPVHPCCAIHAVESPGQPCPACEASKKAARRGHRGPSAKSAGDR